MLFSALQEKDFIGRQEELMGLYKRALQADAGASHSVVLSGPRGIGKTELLKQLFGLLFWKQDRIAPFYYTVNPALLSTPAFSKNYLVRFLCQRLAFEKKEQALLHHGGMSLSALSALVEDRDAAWAKELIDQYQQNADDPVNALHLALAAPRQSALITGMPVVVLIDEFQRLKELHIEGAVDPRLVSLFEGPMSFRKTPHVITGNIAEVQEMSVSSGLERIPLGPLGFEDASSRARALLHAHEVKGNAPTLLLRRLGGNPFYLGCVIRTACAKQNPEDKDFWNAYIREIMEGEIALSWSSVLKRFLPDLELRRIALAITYKIHHTAKPLSCRRIATSFTLADSRAEAMAHALYLAGFIHGEFGVFRAVEDQVLRDLVDCFYLKEFLAKPSRELEREFLERLLPEKTEKVARYDMTLPMDKEAELVAAQCLEQIGKNLGLNQDAVGRIQIALIEACINAIEHGNGTENKIHVTVVVDGDHLEVSIESDGREFIVQETGEPFSNREISKAAGRGWGIKLMKRFADDVRFEKTSRGMKTVLIKNLQKSVAVREEDTIDHE